MPSDREEKADETLPPEKIAESLACDKAENVFARYPSATVLGADTIVCFEGKILGKPKSKEDAAATLRMLSGRTHSVFTGYCILYAGARISGACETKVEFNELSERFVVEYVDSGLPMDKAGSYGIQDDGRLVKRFTGSYTNIVGLPLEEIEKQFKKIGILQ